MFHKSFFLFLSILCELFYLHFSPTHALFPFLYWIFLYLFFIDIETRLKYYIIIPSLIFMDFSYNYYFPFHLIVFGTFIFFSLFIERKILRISSQCLIIISEIKFEYIDPKGLSNQNFHKISLRDFLYSSSRNTSIDYFC